MSRPIRKIKKSFSISQESQRFLRKMQTTRKISSESETLDVLLRELIVAQQQQAIASAYTDYYDSLSDEDVQEQRAWGDFAQKQLIAGAR